MATSYPDRTNARGIWTGDDITKNIKTQGTWPNAAAKALVGGGDGIDVIDQFIISTTGNATDFGDLTAARYQLASCGSNTRGIFIGGRTHPAHVNIIDYVTIVTAGDATVTFDQEVSGTHKMIANEVTVPANSVVDVIDKPTSFYLEETDLIRGGASAASTIDCVVSYEALAD